MNKTILSERFFLFSYFVGIITVGAIILWLPFCWKGEGRLAFVDALFTSTSAVCVTGLITVDTAQYSLLGQVVIMALIQFGGLGIISFSTIYLVRPRLRLSMTSYRVIKGYSLDSVEVNPLVIIRQIVTVTLAIEAAGAVILFFGFRHTVERRLLFASIFHAVSAFCNAGFSVFSTNLEGYVNNATVCFAVMGLIVLGGIGFVVLQDLWDTLILGDKRNLSLHSKGVLLSTLWLILIGAGLFFLFERRTAYLALSYPWKLVAALFQSITPRTAGFDTVSQASLTSTSQTLTMLLMFIGGASGSTAGGIKVNTFFIVTMLALRGTDPRGEVSVFNRKIPAKTIDAAIIFILKALMLLFMAIFLLNETERVFSAHAKSFIELAFETFSAFGTVGLSLGITSYLSLPGKLIIIGMMFMGRVGLLALAIPVSRKIPVHLLDYPREEVMVG
jgi:trk system potassium uptake protein TrkH